MDVTRVDVEKVAEENPQSRFRIHDTAILKPGVCALCASSGGDGRQFVDFGKTVEFFGCVYFCTYCIAEAGRLLGLMPVAEREAYQQELEEKVINANSMAEAFQEQLNAARLLLRNCHCDNTDLLRSDSADDAVDVEVIEDSDGHNVDDGESGSFEGSDDIPEPSADESDVEPVKPKRTRRSSNSDE